MSAPIDRAKAETIHRDAMAKTARMLRETAQKAGKSITHTEALARVHSADQRKENQK